MKIISVDESPRKFSFCRMNREKAKLETIGVFPKKMTNHLTDFGLLIR